MFDDYERARHSVTKLHVHLIFTTKYRRKVMTPEVLESVLAALKITAEDLGCSLLIRCHTNFRHPFNLSWSGKTCDIRRSSKTTS